MKRTKEKSLIGIFVSLLVIMGLGIVSIGMASAAPTVSIDPALTTGLSPGDTFSINVSVDPESYGVLICEVNLTYDASAFTVDSVTEGELMEPVMFRDSDSGPGWEYYLIGRALQDTPIPTDSGTFINVTFSVNSGASDGEYPLSLSGVNLWNATTVVELIPGIVVNGGNAIVDTTAPDIQFVEPPTPVNDTEINVSYVNVTVNVTDNFDLVDTVALLWWGGANETMFNIWFAGNEAQFYFNKTGLANGTYSYKVYANDTAGNMGVSETRVVRVANVTVNGTVSGTISYSCNETGMEGATVKLITPGGTEVDSATTNASGGYTFADVTPGDYYVNASKTFFRLNSTYVTVGVGETVTVDMMLLLQGDMNSDCHVGWDDFLMFADAYGSSEVDANYDVLADLDDDGDVDWDDFLMFADVYGI